MRWFLRSGLRWAILALLVVAFLWFVPQLQGENLPEKVPATDRAALVNEYRRTWAQIIGGFGLLLGLYFTWRRIEISQQELESTRDQQVTERFTRAIDQLGATDNEGKNKKLEIRLGGIYALERIAVDSFAMETSPGRDYSTVMAVLTAYVRENTSQAPAPSKGPSDAASTSNEATVQAEERAKQRSAPPEPRRPTADIRAILDVLRRTQARVPEEYRTRLDLREANLRGAYLEGAYLKEADLREATVQGADLRETRITEDQIHEAAIGDETTRLPGHLGQAADEAGWTFRSDYEESVWPTEVECVAEEHHRFTEDALWIREVEEGVAWRVDTSGITCPEDGSRVEALPGQGQDQ